MSVLTTLCFQTGLSSRDARSAARRSSWIASPPRQARLLAMTPLKALHKIVCRSLLDSCRPAASPQPRHGGKRRPHTPNAICNWYKTGRAALVCAALFAVPGAQAAKARNTTVAVPASIPVVNKNDFDAFRLVVDRNIFNPNRVGRATRSTEEAPPRVDTVALVGTMQSDNGIMAFFDSTDAAYRKALREGETLGSFTVKRILPVGVELMRDDKSLSLKVSQQLRRVEDGEWRVGARDPVRAETALPAETLAAPVVPADASEVLRRLMEKRQKQLKQ